MNESSINELMNEWIIDKWMNDWDKIIFLVRLSFYPFIRLSDLSDRLLFASVFPYSSKASLLWLQIPDEWYGTPHATEACSAGVPGVGGGTWVYVASVLPASPLQALPVNVHVRRSSQRSDPRWLFMGWISITVIIVLLILDPSDLWVPGCYFEKRRWRLESIRCIGTASRSPFK